MDTTTPTSGEPGAVDFGPEYPKIQTCFKRDERNVIVPGEWSVPEFEYLADLPWRFTEKVDGTNIRLHWDGSKVTIGGRTDNAQVPAPLVANLAPLLDPDIWIAVFGGSTATVYGEGYGPKIQSGGAYRSDQGFIAFDVLVGRWWLEPHNVAQVAEGLGLDVVPLVAVMSLSEAIERCRVGGEESNWPGVRIEGYVGTPTVGLFNRKGERIIAKVKAKDWADYARRGPSLSDRSPTDG